MIWFGHFLIGVLRHRIEPRPYRSRVSFDWVLGLWDIKGLEVMNVVCTIVLHCYS